MFKRDRVIRAYNGVPYRVYRCCACGAELPRREDSFVEGLHQLYCSCGHQSADIEGKTVDRDLARAGGGA